MARKKKEEALLCKSERKKDWLVGNNVSRFEALELVWIRAHLMENGIHECECKERDLNMELQREIFARIYLL